MTIDHKEHEILHVELHVTQTFFFYKTSFCKLKFLVGE